MVYNDGTCAAGRIATRIRGFSTAVLSTTITSYCVICIVFGTIDIRTVNDVTATAISFFKHGEK